MALAQTGKRTLQRDAERNIGISAGEIPRQFLRLPLAAALRVGARVYQNPVDPCRK